MSPSVRLELTRLFFKLGPPGRKMGQRDAVDFQTVSTANLALGQHHFIVWDEGVAGSNPATPTNTQRRLKHQSDSFPDRYPPSAFSPSPALGAAIIAASP